MKKAFKEIIDDAVLNGMTTLYMVFVSLISYDNNRTKDEIKQNCETINTLIEVLENYPNNKELQDIKEKLINYNKKYSKGEN